MARMMIFQKKRMSDASREAFAEKSRSGVLILLSLLKSCFCFRRTCVSPGVSCRSIYFFVFRLVLPFGRDVCKPFITAKCL